MECSERRSGNGCKMKVTLDPGLDPGESLLNKSCKHTHVPNPERVESQKVRSRMKDEARGSDAKQILW